jgi:Flp pilus assembly pilin Flp
MGLASDRRGASLFEYVLLIGAVALILLGGFRLFGSQIKSKISGEADSVAALDDRRGSGVTAANDGKALAAAGDKESGKGAARSSDGRVEGSSETSVSAGEKMAAGSKVTSTVSVSGQSGVSTRQASPEAGGPRFNYGWLAAGAGVLVLLAVLFKGKRQLQAEAGADKK